MDIHFSLPADLTERIQSEANARGLSLSEFIKISLESALAQKTKEDPLFSDKEVFLDKGSTDCAVNHDSYLYGDPS